MFSFAARCAGADPLMSLHRPTTAPPVEVVALEDLGVLAVRGADARRFLNGQLSQDTLTLTRDRIAMAGLHNAQGRLLALLRLVPDGEMDVLCVLPRELLEPTRITLSKFVLRSKATLVDESSSWSLAGLAGPSNIAPEAAVGAARSEYAADGSLTRIVWRHASDGREIDLQRCSRAASPSIADHTGQHGTPPERTAREAWRLADIEAELPQVYEATRGEFVAQMLNLDRLDGISFTKGCYTGQEVIARTHYLGRVKRRAQRFTLAIDPVTGVLQPGAAVTLPDARTAQVVEAVRLPPSLGGEAPQQRVLAVATLDERPEPATPR